MALRLRRVLPDQGHISFLVQPGMKRGYKDVDVRL
jgi:hypothetical protein